MLFNEPCPPTQDLRVPPPRPIENAAERLSWPEKYDVLGVKVSAVTYGALAETLLTTAQQHGSAIVDFSPVDIVVQASRNPRFRNRINSFDMVCPDGQPVRWFLNYFHGAGLPDRVCGTTAMLTLCEAAAQKGVSVYLYGSTPDTLERLTSALLRACPNLAIAGVESPPFRPLTEEEDAAAVRRINESGAGLVFIGIGSPRQENFAWEHRGRIQAVALCVGAAFDFIAGSKKRAPGWMQRAGLEWLFRLGCEPGRLWKRYLTANCAFVIAALGAGLRLPRAS